ncbi:MAG: efflux RND transporter periplasmic adaptor subunit [Candidatus Sulfotelmatobacter sp.]|jgi:RND family efflux transporter MFP subunit
MTKREKRLVQTGMLCGMVVAAVLFIASRRLHDSGTADLNVIVPAQAQDSEPATSKESESAGGQTLSTLQLSDQEQQQIGVQTVKVDRRNLRRTLSAVAQVEQPETKLATVSARISGRIDKLFVDFTGQPVRRGQEIALIYSPEIFSTAEEYRLALENRKRLGSNAEPQAVSGAEDLVAAGRRRLELWGLTSQQIDGIAASTKPQIDLPIYSPANGIVTERKVTEGQYVSAGESLYTLSDLSTVWVKAELYQPDIATIRIGQPAEITWDAPSGSTRGRVAFVDPMVNTQTRTASVRIQVANPKMRLRPGMFVDVKFAMPEGNDMLAVPRSAVVDTGTRKIVYVSTGNGNFDGREVRLGQPSDQYYPVLAGLKAGDRVVAQGNFLIDSQTRITGGMTGLFGGSKQYESGQAAVSSEVQFRFSADPASPKGGSNATVRLAVLDASGKPISDAAVKVALVMPAMPAMNMPETRSPADLNWDGTQYTGTVKVPSSGAWNVEIEARRNGQVLGTYRSRLVAQ